MKFALLNVGSSFNDDFVVTAASIRTTKPPRRSSYLAVTLSDGTDALSGNVWNFTGSTPEIGAVYTVSGSIGVYQGNKQLNINTLMLSDNQDTSRFECAYCEDYAIVWLALLDRINDIKSDYLRKITMQIYEDFRYELLCASSAVSMHHVGACGNLIHSIETHDIAVSIVDALTKDDAWVHKPLHDHVPTISRDLVAAGALLHDIGKAFIYTIKGPAVEYTTQGLLFEHIALADSMIVLASQQTPENTKITELLRHIILSHHGKTEYGSPVIPKFIEAVIVNLADGVSASVAMAQAANEKAHRENAAITDKIFGLGNYPFLLQSTIKSIIESTGTDSDTPQRLS